MYVASWWSASVTGGGRSNGAGDSSAGWTVIQWWQVRHWEPWECGIYWVNTDTLLLFPDKPGQVMACRRASTIHDWFVSSSLPSPSLPNPLPFLTHTFTQALLHIWIQALCVSNHKTMIGNIPTQLNLSKFYSLLCVRLHLKDELYDLKRREKIFSSCITALNAEVCLHWP